MELSYQITEQDYVDFNLDYFNKNAAAQRSVMITRWATALLVISGGTALLYLLHSLRLVPFLMYMALAIVCFFATPWYMKRKIVKNMKRILQKANNKKICGEKTLYLRENEFELTGENEDTVYRYEAVQRTSTDENHYYIFVDTFSALIIPFSAFSNEEQKQEFYRRITAHITDEALKC